MSGRLPLSSSAASWWRRGPAMAFKRVADIVVAIVVLVAASPIMLLVAAVIKATSRGPILFHQPRLGYDGHTFELLKFRTMTDQRDRSGALLPDEQRMTRSGALLRRSTLDELPELINVLRGQMSIVGPRPLLVEYRELYTDAQWRRHAMPPGMAGLVVMSGRNGLSWEDKLELDGAYVDRWSLALDLRILIRSVAAVVRRDGVSADGHVTMPRFQGGGNAR